MGGLTLSEEWMGAGEGGVVKQKEGREGELWFVCKMNKSLK